MAEDIIWLKNGEIVEDKNLTGFDNSDDLYNLGDYVQLKCTDREVRVQWSLFSANWSSLYFALEWIECKSGPFRLRYFLAGWFEEVMDSSGEVRERIMQLIAKSDIHLSRRTYIKEVDPEKVKLPNLIKTALDNGSISPDHSVDMVFDDDSGRYLLERIGAKSCIAKLFGSSPVSYPCVSGNSYDQIVSQAYGSVLRRGGVHYDHIVAAMNTRDKTVVWYPYQRVILPHRFPDGRNGVSVVAELADVDIHVV